MHLTPLHARFGAEVHGVDLRTVDADGGYPALRAAFEEHSLLLFRRQSLDDEAHLALGALFGPIEDRSLGGNGPAPRMDNVTNRLENGALSAPDAEHTLNLKANQLWHTDSTFLPVPALANILAARVLSSSGGETEFASTRAAWRDLPESMRERLRSTVFRHRFTHSRAKISPDLAKQEQFVRWDEQAWKAVWRNPVNGQEALYIASHVCAVDGLTDEAGQALVEELITFITRAGCVYTHTWQPGDVLIWDERAMVHRGRPWPYEEERTLASICVSARDLDGLGAMRPGQGGGA
jgi:alpha-ketoglutarate-dependent 2,4-dichlorophenoxyacetate dioxygenase